MEGVLEMVFMTFQSTPSVGRATGLYEHKQHRNRYFNPRPPWGGRQEPDSIPREAYNISIHALRGEGDYRAFDDYCVSQIISIHALRGEGDGG